MNDRSSTAHLHSSALSHLVDKACRHWQARKQVADAQRDITLLAARAFTVALARQAGTQGTAVALEVGKLLAWPVYDHELLELIAQDMGLRTNLLDTVDERHQSWLLETAQAFLAAPLKGEWSPLVTESGYVHHLVQTVLALGLHGECVIVGRGAAFILPAETTLRVRLVGPVRDRVAALSRNLGLSEREAARQVRSMDRARADFVQDHFFKDPTDPTNYDLLLNAPRLSISQCAEVIVETLRRLEAHARAGSGGDG